MPEVVDKAWALVAATPMLKYASFMPNNPQFGDLNAIIYTAIQGVESGRLTAKRRPISSSTSVRRARQDVVVKTRKSARHGSGATAPAVAASSGPKRGLRHARLRARPAATTADQLRAFPRPGVVLMAVFFVVPVLIDIAVSFTDLGRSLRVTKFTPEQYEPWSRGDPRLRALGLTFIYVFGTLAIFNVTFGLVLALTTTSLSKVSAASSAGSGCCRG